MSPLHVCNFWHFFGPSGRIAGWPRVLSGRERGVHMEKSYGCLSKACRVEKDQEITSSHHFLPEGKTIHVCVQYVRRSTLAQWKAESLQKRIEIFQV